jgi:hypothetical protein
MTAAAVFGAQDWLTVNTVYSYNRSLVGPVLAENARRPARPFVLIESTYEGEHNSTPEQIRRQAYWTIHWRGRRTVFWQQPQSGTSMAPACSQQTRPGFKHWMPRVPET